MNLDEMATAYGTIWIAFEKALRDRPGWEDCIEHRDEFFRAVHWLVYHGSFDDEKKGDE